MSFTRASGIILHPTSLPSPFGVGDLGSSAFRFADFLEETGQRLWQMLPLGPTGYGNSPYQSLSVFAGNPLLISPEKLFEEGFLNPEDMNDIAPFPQETVDFEAVISYKKNLFKKSWTMFNAKASVHQQEEFEAFCLENRDWLDTFALFTALRETHQSKAWNTWEEDIKLRRPEAVAGWTKRLESEINNQKFQQFHFFKQWRMLKEYCNRFDIELIGDIPIFVAFDSADVWSHPELFQLDEEGNPLIVAGVPPDYFSSTGQLWGNPMYRWTEMAKNGYDWWVERFRAAEKLVDIIRIDHFRGFAAYWEIPGGEKTAIKGRWVPGPGAALFRAVEKALGTLPIIVEDLGVITPDVDALREELGYPGMRVLQFAFGTDAKADAYKPYNYPRNCAVYTATHDNDTTAGWFYGAGPGYTTLSSEQRQAERENALKYTGTDGHEISWDFIRLAMMSVADTAITPLQDVLGLGTEARMNRPGTAQGNWCWRFLPEMLNSDIKKRLAEMTATYGRI